VALPKSVKLVNAELLKEKIWGVCVWDGLIRSCRRMPWLRYGDYFAGEIERLVLGLRKALAA